MLLSCLKRHTVGVLFSILGLGLSDDSAWHLPKQRLAPACKNAEERSTVIHVVTKRLAFTNHNVSVEIAWWLQNSKRDGFASYNQQTSPLMNYRSNFINCLFDESKKRRIFQVESRCARRKFALQVRNANGSCALILSNLNELDVYRFTESPKSSQPLGMNILGKKELVFASHPRCHSRGFAQSG